MMLKHRKVGAVRRKLGGIELEVCWRDDKFGKGPCFSVYHQHTEVLRFDLFDHGAHWHSYREPNQPRHYFSRSGESFAPNGDIGLSTAMLSRESSPPWDVRVRAAIEIAVKKYPSVGAARTWLEIELAAAWRAEGRTQTPAGR